MARFSKRSQLKTTIEVTSLVLVGLIAGAELGSWCCVQPVVARLPYEQYVAAEQAMLPHIRPNHEKPGIGISGTKGLLKGSDPSHR
jgi:hypothetical protein